MTGAVASSSLSRRTPHLLVGNPCRHAVNFSTRLPQPLARHLARNAPDPRLQPTVVPYFKPHSRYLTQTPVTLRKKPTDGPRTESSASGASSTIHSAGQAANSQGGDAEPMNGALGRDLSSTPPTPPPQPPPPHSSQASQAPGSFSAIPFSTGSGIFDAFLTTVVGLGMVFVGGIAYVEWYKANVLDKIEQAFSEGYDPALELANRAAKRTTKENETYDPNESHEWDLDGYWTEHLRREGQDLMDRIVRGSEGGHYFVLLGPKGTGKTTMLYEAMQAIRAEGVSICEAHPDLEVFRLRLGKALNYEFHEDSQTGLFQRRDPREGGPALDIERALNKMEKVALRYSDVKKRPLVLILNNVHLFKNDDDGKQILLQFQQRAEAWAASGIVTIVFSSDDFWPFLLMRRTASRMHVVSVSDLNQRQALQAAMRMRQASRRSKEAEEAYKQAVSIVGGRLAYLNKVARNPDMMMHATNMLSREKAWLQSQIGLIPDHDDDVMDEQKWSSCSWLLLREFVKKRQEQVSEVEEQIAAGEKSPEALEDLPLPKIPYYQCRQIMTRPDFLEELDRLNIIAIDINHDVTPDSLLLLHAAREVVEEEGFDDQLDDVRDRVDEIESLHRTRELTFKDVKDGDRIRLSVDKGGSLMVEQPS